jgi:hypothetical protein
MNRNTEIVWLFEQVFKPNRVMFKVLKGMKKKRNKKKKAAPSGRFLKIKALRLY